MSEGWMLNFATRTVQADAYQLHGSVQNNAERKGKVGKY